MVPQWSELGPLYPDRRVWRRNQCRAYIERLALAKGHHLPVVQVGQDQPHYQRHNLIAMPAATV